MDNGKYVLGRIAGIPVLIDPTFLLLVAIWMFGWMRIGTSQAIATGFVVVMGIAACILLHEFGHAFAGRYFGTRVGFVELNGLGGLCQYSSGLPSNPWSRIAISLAGPAVNLALYFLLDFLIDGSGLLDDGNRVLLRTLSILAMANWWLFVFNMLPAFPLDGGQALRDLLGMFLPGLMATKIVAGLGLIVCAGCIFYAIENQAIFLGAVAVLLAITNWRAFQDAARPPWQRWN